MKILRITTEINRSSIGRTTEQLGELVLSEGWESYIAYGRTDGNSKSRKIKIGNMLSVYTHVALTRFFDMHGYGSYCATKKFLRQVEKISPDLIHLHGIHGYYLNLKLLFSYLASHNIPIVWTQHDCWAFTGHCAHYVEANCDKWETQCTKCPLSRNYPSSLLYDGSRRNYLHKKELFTSLKNATIVSVSDWMKQQVDKSFLNVYPSERIYNGIDTNVFKPMQQYSSEVREKYGFGNKYVLIAFATAWSESKGLSYYCQLRSMLDDRYVVVLVGMPKYMADNLPDGIIGLPRTDSIAELVKLYSSADIVLNFSKAESFGKTTPEGLACGIPSIVFNSTASPELIDNVTGRVVKRGDISSAKMAIEEILGWDKQQTIANCRNRAESLFNKDENWKQYIALYKRILNVK